MQQLWSRVLAGEANKHGSFSKRTLALLASLDKSDAELFTVLCGFCLVIGKITPLVFNVEDKVYSDKGIVFDKIMHLESIGLVQFNAISGFLRTHIPKKFQASYYGSPIDLTLPGDKENALPIGHVLLTQSGEQLARICGARPVPGFVEYVRERWQAYLPAPSGTTQ